MESNSAASFPFGPKLLLAIEKAGYSAPTPIQQEAFPAILTGKDIMGLARTGSGKTAAFVLPLVERLAQSNRQLRTLILVPTRELAEQVHEVVKQFGGVLGLKSTTIYGGVSMVNQVRALRQGVDIAVCCPGRLLDHIQQRTIALQSVQALVLDEADQMFDMGFLPTIRQILRSLPSQRQNLLFSATMPPEIRELTLQVLRDPIVLTVDRSAPTASVTHELIEVRQDDKTETLVTFLKDLPTDSVLVFTRTKHRAKKLAQRLGSEGHAVTCLQGNLSQNRRQEAMQGFRSGKYRILVATDIAARGIDVASVSHVINFDMPATVEAYTHRIGRTGRASREGDAFTFVTHEDEGLVRSIERTLRRTIPRRRVSLPGIAEGAPSNRPSAGARDRDGARRSEPHGGSGHRPAPLFGGQQPSNGYRSSNSYRGRSTRRGRSFSHSESAR